MRQSEVYKYNPDQQPEEELEATFVAREAILDRIIDDLRGNITADANQHFLLVGPRGVGKTTLLLMIRRRVRQEKALDRCYLPVRTAEEEYSIASLRDLFARILELLAQDGVNGDLAAAAEQVDATADDDHAAELAIEALRRYCHDNDRKLLLLIDNLDLILGDQMNDDAQRGRLRDLLMNESFLVLVGTAPTHFNEVSGYDRPFYQFFRTMNLEELTADQVADLLRKRAEADQNEALLERFDDLRPRLNAIYHLTGGNPRLALMLYQLYTRSELPEVRTSILALLDDVTPYYKARLESLSAQQRKVMDTFARLGHPATPTELAKEVRLPVNQVTSVLTRLRELGFVAIAPQKRRKSTLYMVAERIFRIWHQMRYSRETRQRLEFLIEFIRVWYSPQEWKTETQRLLGEYRRYASEQQFIDAGRFAEYLDYLVHAAPRPEWGNELEGEAVRAYIDAGELERAETILKTRIREAHKSQDPDQLAENWCVMGVVRYRRNELDDAISALEKSLSYNDKSVDTIAFSAWLRLLHCATGQPQGRKKLLRQAVEKFQVVADSRQDEPATFDGWGEAMRLLALESTGEERRDLLRAACEKFDTAVRLNAHDERTLDRYARAVAELWQCGGGPDDRPSIERACETLTRVLETASDNEAALASWALATVVLAAVYGGAEFGGLLKNVCDRVARAAKHASDRGENKAHAELSGAVFAIGLVGAIPMHQCAGPSDAGALAKTALDHWPQADAELASSALRMFFAHMLSEETSELCAALVDRMRQSRMDAELDLLTPFTVAIRYWQTDENKRSEVLDRLNPEMREVVEEIIRGERPGDYVIGRE